MSSYGSYTPSGDRAEYSEKDEEARPPLNFIDVWTDEAGVPHIRSGELPYDQVEAWLDLKVDWAARTKNGSEISNNDVSLRLVSCNFARHPFALGCGTDTFELLHKSFRLHATSEESILNNNGAFSRYLTKAPISREVESLALVIKVPNSVNIGFDAVTLSHDLRHRTTRAFVHGSPDSDFAELLVHLQTIDLVSALDDPFLIPGYILRSHRGRTEAHRSNIDDLVFATEHDLDYAPPGIMANTRSFKLRKELTNTRLSKKDFERTVRGLHSCATALSVVSYVGNFGKDLGRFLQVTAEEMQNHLARTNGSLNPDIMHALEFQTNLYTTLVLQTSVLKDRVQSHINLTFSLIAQEENRISRSISEESALIAVAAKRDSAAMKTIALITIIFLPPTFVATFFSMTMFDWTPNPEQPDSRIASVYLWVYWVVAIPLTITVLIIWRVWWTMEEKKYNEELNNTKAKRQIVRRTD
ncbi:hypothetical protein BCR34DRAFT_518735 [Clohesyomyces aquaticus]|uniref:Cora-like Mg2+ transporter protein-domain-containing protein n=1 Tax=Clohesyomyces aquaticus TaxID=1231657 RepID=A0A1Y1Z9H8_9PLEO|nr:hypothetical protein BCR34DRAFT_518735 [Clohesyomyces aquaticus]